MSANDLKQLGRYEIKGVLGKGAMGLVYDGLDPTLNRRVAIKTILTRNLDAATAKQYAMRFQREVRAVARINHPNIVQVYDFGQDGDLAFIVMEYIEGKELKDSFDKKEGFDLGTTFRLMQELLGALDYAHEAGVIHRDIKPANVMVDAKGHAKLTDFGVARIEDPDAATGEATRAGAVIGTPSYMSPEQIQGQSIDRRTDIFSAGIILYQFLTWQKPFEGTQWVLASKIIQEDPVWPSQLVQVSPELDRVVARALAKQADQRYQTARQFANALKRVFSGKPAEDATDGLPPLAAAASSAAAAAEPDVQGTEAEKEFWNEVKDSDEPEDIELYLEQFPRGMFAQQAKDKLAALKK